MQRKTWIMLVAFLLSGSAFAAPHKLDNYEAVKTELLEGKAIKAVIDFGKCTLVEGDNGGRGLHNIVGMTIDNFMISARNNAIYTSHNFLNSIDNRTPYALVGYRLGDLALLPNHDVVVDTAVMRIPDFKILAPIRLLCKMSEGANFFTTI